VKSAILLSATILLGVTLFFYRKRLGLALQVAGGLYIVSLVVRFFLLRDEPDRFAPVAVAVGLMTALWLVTDIVTRLIRRRRARRAGR
jgi:hypothetical protein